MCGTARRDARIAGNSVSSNAACHSASVVSSRSLPPARPTLLTRMSRPPNVSTVRVDDELDARRRRDVGLHRGHHVRPPGGRFDFDAPLRRAAPRRARRGTTRQPSATSARALASPSPRLEPVTMATLSVSPRSMNHSHCHFEHSLTFQFPRPPVRSFSRQSNSWNVTLNSFFCTNSFSSGSSWGG